MEGLIMPQWCLVSFPKQKKKKNLDDGLGQNRVFNLDTAALTKEKGYRTLRIL
jgi:hypothetical protein